MIALKMNFENLKKVAERICSVDYDLGSFSIIYLDEDFVTLSSPGRSSFGSSVSSFVPCNWSWRITFKNGLLLFHIWF